MTDTTWQLSATWSSTSSQLIPSAPEGTRNVPSGRVALRSDREMGLMADRSTGPLSGFQIAPAKRSIPASERSSVRSRGIRTVLLASSTNEVSARVR